MNFIYLFVRGFVEARKKLSSSAHVCREEGKKEISSLYTDMQNSIWKAQLEGDY